MNGSCNIDIIACGHALPGKIQSNEELCKNLPVDPDWIIEKTGITQRYHLAENESALDLAVSAAKRALVDLESAPKIDLIVVATFSGDYVFPPVSAALARELGIKSCQIFDLQANCAGFVSALTVAADRLAGDLDMSRALVVGLEVNSTYVSMSDQDSAVYLSDAAGAVVLEKTSADGTGLLASRFDVDASSYEAVRMRGGGSRFRNIESSSDHNARFMEMNGIATWKQAVTNLPRVIRECCSKARLELHEVDFVIFHQANLNMINYIMRKLKIHESKTYTNVARIGNSGAASVPVALSEAVSQGKIKSGDIVLLAAVGAGFNFGASVWRWR